VLLCPTPLRQSRPPASLRAAPRGYCPSSATARLLASIEAATGTQSRRSPALRDAAFIATGVTDGEMLRGVKYFGQGSRTHSITMENQTGTVRFIETVHRAGAEKFWVRMD
jgi:fructose-1,6-bisphosphatase II